jgi:hypothetical protein
MLRRTQLKKKLVRKLDLDRNAMSDCYDLLEVPVYLLPCETGSMFDANNYLDRNA